MEKKTPHIAILPSPGMGHLIPMAEFAKRLLQDHHISATIIIPTTGPPPQAQISVLESLPENIHHLFLPPVATNLPPETRPEIRIFFTMQACLSSLRDALTSLKSKTHLVGLVFDMFGHDSMEVAQDLNLFKLLFFPMSAMALSCSFIIPNLDKETSCEYRDLPYPIQVPGSVSFHGRELMAPVQIRTDEAYKGYLEFCKTLTSFDGILVNSFQELEEETFRVLTESSQTPIYPIGPLIRSDPSNGSDRHECLVWLDHQPSKSVVLVSFGSGGTLPLHQILELAKGLEMSGQRFLWILKSPNEKASNASFFTASSQSDSLGFLPQGFLDRTKSQGLVVTSWAPQIEILSHGATGGFLTHCGWNSVLESVVHGVPMIAWPLYAEQHMNAKVMTESLSLALRAETDEDGIVRKEVIEKVVKGLMEGDEGKKIKKRLDELKVASIKALSDGGSSMESLSKFAVQLIKK